MKSPSYLLVWNKKSQELFQLSHQLLGWSNSKIWIVHLLSVKTWFTDTERGHHQMVRNSPLPLKLKGNSDKTPNWALIIPSTKNQKHSGSTKTLHCKYIRSNYDGITAYHRTSTIFRLWSHYSHQYTVPKLSSTR